MVRLVLAFWIFVVLSTGASMAQSSVPEDIYTTQAVVTGKDERNRPLGFRLCFEDVLVKASGDADIVNDKRVAALAANAGQYITSFSYRDRLAGKPIHDEQGSYDRPHFLTCHFDSQKIDDVLKVLGKKPWPAPRPRLVMLLAVKGAKNGGILSSDGAFDANMRESLANAARRYGLMINLPSVATLQDNRISVESTKIAAGDRLQKIAASSNGDLPLVGRLRWSDAATGWVAAWNLKARGRRYRWSVRGVNYDEAFRNAVRGAMQALSGNGAP